MSQPTHAGPVRELISFRVDGQEFCVDIMAVREIRGWTPATALPRSPDFIRGVISLRGVVLPIVDLALRLGFKSVDPTARHVIIVTQIGAHLVGLLVDAVSDILTITQEAVQPTPEVASGSVRTFVLGLLTIDDRLISLIGLDRILPDLELDAAA
jgi:purine-binding chemotaxis protein CheW